MAGVVLAVLRRGLFAMARRGCFCIIAGEIHTRAFARVFIIWSTSLPHCMQFDVHLLASYHHMLLVILCKWVSPVTGAVCLLSDRPGGGADVGIGVGLRESREPMLPGTVLRRPMDRAWPMRTDRRVRQSRPAVCLSRLRRSDAPGMVYLVGE